MKVTDVSLRRPVTVIILTLALVYFGLFAYKHMGMQQIPDVDMPVIMVTTTMPGATAAVMDNDVTDVIEEQINTISGIDSLSSSSYNGVAVTVVQFDLNRDIDGAAADVRDKINAASVLLPEEADTPVIAKYSVGDSPLVMFSVTGDASYREKVHFVDKIAKVKLQAVSGVGNISTPGMRDREIRVWIDPVRLRSRGLVASDLLHAISRKHVELPAGSLTIDRFKMDLRIQGEYSSVEELKSLPITARDGVVIRLGDVADVEDGFAEVSNAAYQNDSPMIMLLVQKQRGANEVAVCDAIIKGWHELADSTPSNITMTPVYNKSEFIRRSMHGVTTDAIQAVVLCSLLMLFFLQTFRATFVTIISMPVCLLGSFSVLMGLGVTINSLSMMGISLAVGMVVDATTVVMENIYRHLDAGESLRVAASKGTDEVGFSVLGGALTTIGVFAPIAFMGGVIGRFFYAFGITVVVTIILSLIISLTLTPFACSRLLKVNNKRTRAAEVCTDIIHTMERGYKRVLTAAVRHKFIALGAALAFFVFGIFVAGHVGSGFMVHSDQGIFLIHCEMDSGTDVEETGRVLERISEVVRNNPAVERTLVVAGVGGGQETNKGAVYAMLYPRSTRPGQEIVMDEVRHAVSGFKDVKMEFTTFGGKDFSMVLNGASTEKLLGIAHKIIDDMNATGNVKDVDTDIKMDKPQLNINIDRNMTDAMNVDVKSLATEVQAYFGGIKAGVFKQDGFRYDIRLMARGDHRKSLDDLQVLSFKNGEGEIVQAPGLITVKRVNGPNVIKRYGRQTAVTISGNVEKNYSMGQAVTLMKKLAAKYIPEGSGISLVPSGDTKSQQEDFARLLTALIIAISLVYIIMAVQFESFLHPLTVMFSLPLLTPGAFILLYITGCNLDMMAYMGIILLVGIVVNNGIILVDFINQNRAGGMELEAAVIDAGPKRLRAILITSLSTLIGALPAMLKLSEGSESRQPMSAAIFGGLFTSTLLTLLVVPVVYILFDRAKSFLARKFFRRGCRKELPASEGVKK